VKDDSQLVSVRVTAVVVDDGHILLVRQHVDDGRQWSLPGGRLERGEQIGDALVREVEEETGLVVEPDRLLYVADVPEARPPLVHITMSMRAVRGTIRLPTNEHDENTIYDVRYVPVQELPHYGFSDTFTALATSGFPDGGRYVGRKANIGL
jgi:ADP-ribose pyrophosphatase YjhB (NUDIX family)